MNAPASAPVPAVILIHFEENGLWTATKFEGSKQTPFGGFFTSASRARANAFAVWGSDLPVRLMMARLSEVNMDRLLDELFEKAKKEATSLFRK